MNKSWPECTTLITGGKRGMGKAFALQLAELGSSVIITSRNPEREDVKQTLEEISKKSLSWSQLTKQPVREPIALPWEMNDKGDCDLDKLLKERNMVVDILIHAAHSIPPYKVIFSTSPSELADSLQRNVVATYSLLQIITRKMVRRNFGRILLIGSLSTVSGGVGMVSYITEKAAIEGMMRAFSVEFNNKNIVINMIHPTIVATENIMNKFDNLLLDQYKKMMPSNRLLIPNDIVQGSLSLVNPMQNSITGQSLNINGGLDTAHLIYMNISNGISRVA